MHHKYIAVVVLLFGLVGESRSEEVYTWGDFDIAKMEHYTPRSLYVRFGQCFYQRDFTDLDAMFDRARDEALLDEKNRPVLFTLYESMFSIYYSAPRSLQEELRSHLNEWLEEHDQSKAARVISFRFKYDDAWYARGGGYANEVEPDRMKKFGRMMNALRKEMDESRDALSDDFLFHSIDLRAKRGAENFDDILASVERTYKLQPYYSPIFEFAAVAALPSWTGSDSTINRLAEHAYALSREEMGLAAYFRIAAAARSYRSAETVTETYGLNADDVFKGAKDYAPYLPRSENWANNTAARFASELGRREVAQEFFERIVERDEGVWSEAFYNHWRAWARGDGKPLASTTLHEFAALNAASLVEKALEAGADPNVMNEDGYSPIFIAAQYEHWDIVRILAENGADPNLGSPNEGTPLSNAIVSKEVELANFLMDKGASPRTTRWTQEAPIVKAMRRDLLDLVRRIASHPEMNINHYFLNEFTPLNLAISEGRTEVAKILIECGADVEIATYQNFTPLHTAALNKNEEVIRALLEEGADPRVRDFQGFTPLYYAAKSGSEECTTLLLNHPLTDVNVRTAYDYTALHVAAGDGIPGVVRILVEHPDIDVDAARVENKMTALHYAAEKGSIGCVRYLVKAGADPNLPNADGKTAIDIVKESGRSRLLDIIQEE